jgi:hypothetical protein
MRESTESPPKPVENSVDCFSHKFENKPQFALAKAAAFLVIDLSLYYSIDYSNIISLRDDFGAQGRSFSRRGAFHSCV